MATPKFSIGIIDTDAVKDKVKHLLDVHPWMLEKKFTMVHKRHDIEKLIESAIQAGKCALDFETEGLNTRQNEDGEPIHNIVGVCLAYNDYEGFYIPVKHVDKDDIPFNADKEHLIRQLKLLIKNCVIIFHHFKYDGQVLFNHGIEITEGDRYEDTMLQAAVEDASRKSKGLKTLSETQLNRKMIEIRDLLGKDQPVTFQSVPVPLATYYGGSDALNTFALHEFFNSSMNNIDPTGKGGMWLVYRIEKKAQLVVLEMERNLVHIDIPYLKDLRDSQIKKRDNLRTMIHQKVGKEFDIDSPKQLGEILFDKLLIPYPRDAQKTESGQYQTDEKVLSKLTSHEIINWVLDYRGTQKILGTYIENFIKNADRLGRVKFQLNQVQADTGRFSASGGEGLHVDGYSGVNCQNISVAHGPNDPNLRRAIIARPGFKLVAIDYSGEELRIAANFSREPKWVDEFVHGTGDIHSITAKALYDLTDEAATKMDKKEFKELRGTGKSVNFLTIYGGGAGRLSAVAKVPMEKAQLMLLKFFKALPHLKRWLDLEKVKSRKRGYSLTAFGRRRPLAFYYESGDKKLMSEGDRKATNAAIQGTGADIMKIALHRVWQWIRENGHQENVRILFPVHDEIVFEMRETVLDILIPAISELMKLDDILKGHLKWPVGLEVDAEYGDTWDVDHNYFEELKKEAEKGPSVAQEKEQKSTEKKDENKIEVPSEEVYYIEIKEAFGEESARILKKIMLYTKENSSKFEGPKKHISIVDKDGKKRKPSSAKVCVDVFKALLDWNKIK
jgi:DNA polymerase-1